MLLPFVCAGYPTPDALGPTLIALSDLGCPVIEIGIPFSDPIADGPVIAAAMHSALNPAPGGVKTTPDRVMSEVARHRPNIKAALVAMVSCSIVLRLGAAKFITHAASSGLDGLIIPDLPLEESTEVRELAARAGLSLSLLIAPTTPTDRAAKIAAACTGFVYMLARTGITGAETGTAMSAALPARVAALRSATSIPIACGFGISKRDDVRDVLRFADAAIVGSAVVRCMGDAASRGTDPSQAAAAFVRTLLPQ